MTLTPFVFVTGTPRSGTTLADKLLSSHPKCSVWSQPLPLLPVRLKRMFLEESGLSASTHPFDDMFGERWYPWRDLVKFVEERRLDPLLLSEVFDDLRHFHGRYTPLAAQAYEAAGTGRPTLAEFIERYCRQLTAGDTGPRSPPDLVGAKETYCEEMLPFFLKRGSPCLLLLRDPRDIITSLNHGRGREFSGRRRPLLWNIRQWRKSIAFALAWQDDHRLLSIRYEDLVRDPARVSRRIAAHLGLSGFPKASVAGRLRAQDGDVWRSNSSHRSVTRIDAGSVGRYRDFLDVKTERLILSLTLPEMLALDYPVDLSPAEAGQELISAQFEESLEREDLRSFLWSEKRRKEESSRFRRWREGRYSPRMFIFRRAFDRLRERPSR